MCAGNAVIRAIGGNFSVVVRGLGAYSERVERPGELMPAFRRAIRASEQGQVAVVEVMIKPMRTPKLPEDWSLWEGRQ